MQAGKVYLVGAGPGDPELISVKGVDCIRRANVVVYDHLLDQQLLNAASPDTERIYIGKTAGRHTLPQEEINQLLVDKAREGKTVVRLKGGDPFVLGRGGEEAEALVKNHISFEVVPGITSATAVPAYAGIPVTHRGLASSFAVITGHEDPNKETSSINWEHLANGVDTLIFLMGMKNLPKIVNKLVENGRPADTSVAIIKNGARPEQETVVGNLENIVDKVEKSHLTAPVIIVIGDVVSLRERLRWFDNRSLSSKRILVTRARHQASVLSRLLIECGAQAIELPAIDIQTASDTAELDKAIINLKDYNWALFTSANGVTAFWERLQELKKDSRILDGLTIGAIGSATAQALVTKGITPDFIPDVYTGEGIIEGLKDKNIAGQRFLLPRADIADKELINGILRLGASVHEVTAYRTIPATEAISRAKQMIISDKIDIITFTSSSTVSNLMAAFGGEPVVLKNTKVACIGPKTAKTAAKAGLNVDILAKEQTIPGLVNAIEEYFREEN